MLPRALAVAVLAPLAAAQDHVCEGNGLAPLSIAVSPAYLGGTLDTDVTTGYGPETFTLARLSPGAWRIQAHYYGGAVPTWIVVTVVEHEGEPEESRRLFRGLLLAAGDVLEVGEVTAVR